MSLESRVGALPPTGSTYVHMYMDLTCYSFIVLLCKRKSKTKPDVGSRPLQNL